MTAEQLAAQIVLAAKDEAGRIREGLLWNYDTVENAAGHAAANALEGFAARLMDRVVIEP